MENGGRKAAKSAKSKNHMPILAHAIWLDDFRHIKLVGK
jgi:hypothetical protein